MRIEGQRLFENGDRHCVGKDPQLGQPRYAPSGGKGLFAYLEVESHPGMKNVIPGSTMHEWGSA